MKVYILLIVFLLGIAIGVAGALLGPEYIEPYIPRSIKSDTGGAVEGKVVAKQLMNDKLLVTVHAPGGKTLVTFNKNYRKEISEVNLLVEKGDLITLGLRAYEPFVTNPSIKGVIPAPSVSMPTKERPVELPAPAKPAKPSHVKPAQPEKEKKPESSETEKPAPAAGKPSAPVKPRIPSTVPPPMVNGTRM